MCPSQKQLKHNPSSPGDTTLGDLGNDAGPATATVVHSEESIHIWLPQALTVRSGEAQRGKMSGWETTSHCREASGSLAMTMSMQPLVLVGLKHSLTLPRRQRQRRSCILRARVVLRVTEAHVPLRTTGGSTPCPACPHTHPPRNGRKENHLASW
jgi:hypothetical protein